MKVISRTVIVCGLAALSFSALAQSASVSGTQQSSAQSSEPCVRIRSARQAAADSYYQAARMALDATFGTSSASLLSSSFSDCFASFDFKRIGFNNGMLSLDSLIEAAKSEACKAARNVTGNFVNQINGAINSFNTYINDLLTLKPVSSALTGAMSSGSMMLSGSLNSNSGGIYNMIAPR